MDTFLYIFRIVFFVISSLISIVYLLTQLYQKIPIAPFKLSAADYIVYTTVSLMIGIGTNSPYGLCAFIPLLLIKFICKNFINLNHLKSSGFWMEINWKKFTPKGFHGNVPKHILDEMNKVVNSTPKDSHFIIPRFYAVIAIKFMLRKMKKESKKVQKGFTNEQQNIGMDQFNKLAKNILLLDKGQSEKKDLNIGILKVTRH